MIKNRMPIKLFFLVLTATLLVLPVSCGKEDHPIPDVWVDITLNLELAIELNNVGGWVYVSGGFNRNGIIVYRWSIDEFMAFDRTCPFHPFDPCGIVSVDDPPIAKCDCCESQYLLIDGSVFDGPSKFPLKQYRTHYQEPYLQITN